MVLIPFRIRMGSEKNGDPNDPYIDYGEVLIPFRIRMGSERYKVKGSSFSFKIVLIPFRIRMGSE